MDFIVEQRRVISKGHSPGSESAFGAAGAAGGAVKNPSASLVRPDCRVISPSLVCKTSTFSDKFGLVASDIVESIVEESLSRRVNVAKCCLAKCLFRRASFVFVQCEGGLAKNPHTIALRCLTYSRSPRNDHTLPTFDRLCKPIFTGNTPRPIPTRFPGISRSGNHAEVKPLRITCTKTAYLRF